MSDEELERFEREGRVILKTFPIVDPATMRPVGIVYDESASIEFNEDGTIKSIDPPPVGPEFFEAWLLEQARRTRYAWPTWR